MKSKFYFFLKPVFKNSSRVLLSVLFLFTGFSFLKAQHIQDKNFASAIKTACSSCIAISGDGTGELVKLNANNLTSLNVESKSITDLTGISGFTSLSSLNCSNNKLASLPTLPNTLTNLECDNNQLASLPTLPSGLTILYCHNNQLASLPTLPSGLNYFYCHNNKLTSLPTLPGSVTFFDCSNNQLTSLPTLPPYLIYLGCHHNQLTSLPTLRSNLGLLAFDNNKITCITYAGMELQLFNPLSNAIGLGENYAKCVTVPRLNVTQPTCVVPTGTILITNASGYTVTTVFSFDGGATFAANASMSRLAPGDYTVIAQDSLNKLTATSVKVTIVAAIGCCTSPPFATFSYAGSPFCGNVSGLLPTFTGMTGGIFSYTDVTNNLNLNATDGTVSCSVSGTYHLVYTIPAANGCPEFSTTTMLVINAKPDIPVATVVKQPDCTTPTGTVTITSPTSGVTYSFDGGNTYQVAATKSGVLGGTQGIVVKSTSVGNCTTKGSNITVYYAPSIPPTPVFSLTQPNCTIPTGTITITGPACPIFEDFKNGDVSDGLSNAVSSPSCYTYSFDGGTTYQASNVKSGLNPGNYNLLIKYIYGSCPSLTAATATLNAATNCCTTPSITVQPAPATQNTCLNSIPTNLVITATTTETGVLNYQWYSNVSNLNTGGTLIANATSASFTPPTNTVGTMYYYCVVTSSCGNTTTTSNTANVVVNGLPAPIISGASTVNINATITLTGSPTGGTWSSSSSAATVGLLTGIVTGKAVGNPTITYTYTDGNGCVGTTTQNVTVSCGAPVISSQPAPTTQTVCQNTNTTAISLSATDPNTGAASSGLTFQWYSNAANSNSGGTLISGATSANYTPPSTTAGTVYYYCVVTSSCGNTTTTSNTANVVVNGLPAPIISGASTVNINATITLTGSPTGGTWSSSSSAATVGLLTGIVTGKAVGNPTIIYTYTDGNGCVGTTTQNVTVSCGAPVISSQPAPTTQTVCQNTSTTAISLSATDPNTGAASSGLTYQWYSNAANSNSGGTLISGATNSSYTPPSTTAGTMYYYCVVTSSCGNTTTTSNTANVVVNGLPAPIISGASSVDVNNVIALVGSPIGGTWSSSTANASVDKNSGVVTGQSVGNATITYTYTDGNGCVGQSTKIITINCPALTISAQPSAISPIYIFSGETPTATATFTAKASNTLPMTVKWQRKGINDASFSDITLPVNYTSNNIASYTTPVIGTSDDGAQYQAVFSTVCNSATTNTSTVSVIVYQYIGLRPYPKGMPECLRSAFRELEKIYNTCNGANWKNKSGWFTDPNMNNWYGIKLTVDGCDVATIDLSNNLKKFAPDGFEYIVNLPQCFESSLNQLSFPRLDTLNLSGNNLSGFIFYYNFPNLKVLNFRNNKLVNNIPDFHDCPKLQKILLDTNQLSGNIPDFKQIKLDTIGISNNNFIFGDMANKSWLSRNAVTYAPQNLIPLTNTNGVLSVNTGEPDAVQIFNWYKDGVLVATTNSSVYKPVLSGVYSCQISHNTLTILNNPVRNLILMTSPLKVAVSSTVQLSGFVLSENNQVVPNVTVDAGLPNSSLVTRTNTDVNGAFTSDVERNARYQLRATKTSLEDKYLGVSTYDIALISKHILGIETLNSPYKIIAADVDKSNEVDAADILVLRRFILNIDNTLPAGVWRFVDKSYNFINPTNPFGEDFPEVATINLLTGTPNANFIAVKIGDVNLNYSAQFTNSVFRSANTVILNVDDQELQAGKEYTIKINADNLTAQAIQGTFEFRNASVKAIKSGNVANISDENFGLFNNAVTMSWNGTSLQSSQLAEITFVANSNSKLSDILTFGSSKTLAVANDLNGAESEVTLKFNNAQPTAQSNQLSVMSVLPNPTKDRVTIVFDNKNVATIRVLDLLGRELSICTSSTNSTDVDMSQFNSGCYIIEVTANGERFVQKVVKE